MVCPMPTLECPFCERKNPEDAKFCNACGSPMHLKPCKECGAVNDIAAKACYKCGALFPARVPKVNAELALEAAPDAATGRLIELFQGSREATRGYPLQQPDAALRTVSEPSRIAAVTRIGGTRLLNQVMVADAEDIGKEKVFRISQGAALRWSVAMAAIAIASVLFVRHGSSPSEPSVPNLAQVHQPSATRQDGPAEMPGPTRTAAPSPTAAAAAPQTAALATSTPPQPGPTMPQAAPSEPRNDATDGSPSRGQDREAGPASPNGGEGNTAQQDRNVATAAESTPSKPVETTEVPSSKRSGAKERGTRRATSRSYREHRGNEQRPPSVAERTPAYRASSGSQRAATPAREPARTSYNCTAAVAALGLCSGNSK